MARKPIRRRRRTLGDRTSWQPRGAGGPVLSGRALSTLALAAVFAVGVGYVVIFSPLVALQHVAIEGQKALDPKVVESFVKAEARGHLGAVQTKSLFLINPSQVETQLKEEFGDIAKVTVTKQYPQRLRVSLTEREQALLWQSGDKYYLVDRQGNAFAKAEPRKDLVSVVDSTNLPVEIGKQIVGSGFIKTLVEIQDGMKVIGVNVVSFRIPETTFEVQAVTDQGYYAVFDTTRNVSTQIEALKQALGAGKPAQYADLRVPGRVYLK